MTVEKTQDHCRKPILLYGWSFRNQTADHDPGYDRLAASITPLCILIEADHEAAHDMQQRRSGGVGIVKGSMMAWSIGAFVKLASIYLSNLQERCHAAA